MEKMKNVICGAALFSVVLMPFSSIQVEARAEASTGDTLVVLWTSGDPEVAEKVALMYTHAAARYEWFDHVILIVWGPSANMLAQNEKLQDKIKAMISGGVQLQACIACADMYGVSEKLQELGIEVTGMGRPLTDYLKKGYCQLSF